jgi:type I restriction-modification system DNA methylase subunit
MNRDQARELVARTFTRSFDRDQFRLFIVNLLNHLNERASHRTASIKDAFKQHVSSYERLGTYRDPGGVSLDVLIVYLTSDAKLERARTAIRNFVADYLNRAEEVDAALVAFVPPSKVAWRFSFVKMDYATISRASGQVDVETRLSPARRFSYIVGEGESCHTAQSRFVEILSDIRNDPTQSQLEDAFSVEAVTKEFFTKYAELFIQTEKEVEKLLRNDKRLCVEFKQRSISTVEFAKKLLGQIVFLYFVQKKGWLGVEVGHEWGTGPRDFLRQLATAKRYTSFFKEVLEPLFYDALATDRGHAALYARLSCRMPFLNGGLFEPLGGYDWKHTAIALPNELFTNSKKFDGDLVGTGILDIFDRYNFTVNEAEPLEKEVAIDPEMLGKIFENLIEENRRRGLGAYYTPREIVHYMCQQALINYLEASVNEKDAIIARSDLETLVQLGDQISHYESVDVEYAVKMPRKVEEHARLLDQILADIKVCDPAVGSGAFLVGMMTEIARMRSALTPYFNDPKTRTPYNFKRHAVHNCLYGVDIDPGAVEIAKLRLWLSLVVDEEDTAQIKPLPNLDFKVITGNSLVGFPFQSQGLQKVEKLKERFFEETDHERRAVLRSEIDDLLAQCYARSKASLGYKVDFDFKVVFSEVFKDSGGFDVVIANPPYLDSEAMTKAHPELRDLISKTYKMARGNYDIYIAFFERGFSVLGPRGGLAFITPDKWISKPFGDELRRQTIGRIFSVLRAGREVFESVKVDAIISVFTQVKQDHLRIFDYDDDAIKLKRIVDKTSLRTPYALDWLFSDLVDILVQIGSNPESVQDHGLCENSCATSDAYKLKPLLKEAPTNGTAREVLKVINTGTIAKFVPRWGLREMVYLGNRYLRPVVDKKRFAREFPNSYGKKSVKPKLIIKGLNLLDACLDDDGTIVPGKTTLIVTAQTSDTLKFLLGLLNSALAFVYIREKYIASSYNEGTTFTKEMINELPVPQTAVGKKAAVVAVVDRILAMKKRNFDSDTAKLELQLNHLIYELYGLAKNDIARFDQYVDHRKTRPERVEAAR